MTAKMRDQPYLSVMFMRHNILGDPGNVHA